MPDSTVEAGNTPGDRNITTPLGAGNGPDQAAGGDELSRSILDNLR
jgi:hypothetical protein